MEYLHPGAKWVFRFKSYLALFFFAAFLFFFTSSFFQSLFGTDFFRGILLSLLFWVLFMVFVGEIYARMAYDRWRYEFTSNNLRIEKGIIWKKYSNIPYERVQNVDVHRGILARIFGFSTVDIQTAGYSMVYSRRGGFRSVSEGHLPAVSIHGAEKIREFLMTMLGKRQGI